MCEDTIEQFCPKKDHEYVLDCLKVCIQFIPNRKTFSKTCLIKFCFLKTNESKKYMQTCTF